MEKDKKLINVINFLKKDFFLKNDFYLKVIMVNFLFL